MSLSSPHAAQRVAGRRLLRLLLVLAGAPPELTVGQPDDDLERLVVVRAVGRGELISRGRLVALLKQLLEAALVVRLQEGAVLPRAPSPDERRGRLVAAVEVDGPDERLDGVGQEALAR